MKVVEQKRNIAILGSTGSIGRQTVDIICEYPDRFQAYLLTANSSVDLLVEQAKRLKPKYVIIANEAHYSALCEALKDFPTEVKAGMNAIVEAMADENIDTVVTAMVGYAGLAPTINAIKHNKTIALANKETLVVAGALINELLSHSQSKLYPVDSEHGAIWQCLAGEKHSDIYKLILTASGGPFRTKTIEQLAHVTKADALKHPNWNMGAKITIDSATMMNKGFEVMEAKWPFDVDLDKIEVVVHPQSIVHSMIEFVDGSVKAQLGLPDMRIPIRYALGYPQRLYSDAQRMHVSDYRNLTFEEPDLKKFPMLGLAYEASRAGGNVPCVLNAANEIAVAAFLHDKIGYNDIAETVIKTMQWAPYVAKPTYDDYVNTNIEARRYAETLIK
ncbi:MAG: 1-deoxy-D-xylulose-5-phosphate reductoisomerase [Muribaculaceae bacterium]|nr:1-deoxy-D-xylulose-5-phosphate reductoisomerase [Muribaculaceae bacterium]